ncbi:MAG: hypothetical protein D6729_06335 [Deltaproteobacteria bacterium]|nr:MAG: hypothetical protein D6729_06335 [Deltaproteobacteria bacterium]
MRGSPEDRLLILLVAAAVLTPGLARAGAWVPRQGHSALDLSLSVLPGATDARGPLEPFLNAGAYAYLETGLLAGRLAGLVQAPLHVVNVLPRTEEVRSGLGDLRVGVRLGLAEGAAPVAAELWARLPTGIGGGTLPTGFGTFGGAAAFFAGRSWADGRWVQGGVTAELLADLGWALRLELAHGLSLSERWSLDGTLLFRFAFGVRGGPPGRVLYRGDERWGALNLRARYRVSEGLAVYFGADLGLVSHNAPKGIPVVGGLSARW